MSGCPLQVKAVQEYLKELLENTDQKLLVFAHHKELLDGVEFAMNKCALLRPQRPHHTTLWDTFRGSRSYAIEHHAPQPVLPSAFSHQSRVSCLLLPAS